jgi:hypothetical protein
MSLDINKAEIIYNGESAEMGTPESEKLIEKMLTNVYPELKGGKMSGIKIIIDRVEGLDIKFKKDSDVLALEAHLTSEDIARLHNLSKQGVPLSVTIESPQAEMDLRIEKINTTTGELWNPKFNPDARD